MKRTVTGNFVKLLFHKQENRNMTLSAFETRCISEKEIHEIVTTVHGDARAGDAINKVGFLGFAEINCGGVIQKGDHVYIHNRWIGRVLGFDECHFPNHYNILIETDQTWTATDLSLQTEDTIRFVDSARAEGGRHP